MKIIKGNLSSENMVFQEIIFEKEMGKITHFLFKSFSENVKVRIKKDNRLIGYISLGEHNTSYISATNMLEKTDSKGNWEFTFFLLKAQIETSFELKISLKNMENKIFHGDLHSHSICSTDATNTFYEIEEEVKALGNDFHAITDHNSFAMNLQYYTKRTEIEFIYGVEMTNQYGHYNFLGIEIPTFDCHVDSEESLVEKILEHKSKGGYVTFNHPFSPKSRVCKLPIIKEYCDFIEIWNGHWATHNKIALKWWHKKLLENIYFPICSGSDTHKLYEKKSYTDPLNYIIAPYNEQSILLSQLKKGHSYILSKKGIVNIEFIDTIFGDYVDSIFNIKFSAYKDYKLVVISNIDILEFNINDSPTEYNITNRTFIRFEAYDKNECIFISNPVFNKSTLLKTFLK